MKTGLYLGLLAVGFSLPIAARADDPFECKRVARVLEDVAERWDDFALGGTKPRMAVVRIGSAAGTAVAYATDAGWDEEALAPLVTIRDSREPDENGQTLGGAEAQAVILPAAQALTEVLAEKCPATELTDINALSLPEGVE